ncbi:DMT family transporter [Sulfitobacter aestuariivivens]|uniref:DMT family transporter n=1 Tax=Sulfitobacter aestuariivivens TaxID=2766981 RepID=A0A927D4F4_9RHOB|nr:DMT family transporter [Sulfitobacter aestuariivivens]MBD3664161.1 DMT family transporter [Sulfitobacter aestuariivivens]
MPILYLMAACLIGAAFATQPAINAAAAKVLGSPIPATVMSVAITLAASIVIMVLGRTTPSMAAVTSLPWWVVIGGLIGVLVVGGGVVIVPVTGVAIFFVCLIAGQLAGSILLDHYGAFGLAVREIGAMRLCGILVTFAGVLLVRYG